MITQKQARKIATEYLIDNVGDLLGVGDQPEHIAGDWLFPIHLGCARYGPMGNVGFINVGPNGSVGHTDGAYISERSAQLMREFAAKEKTDGTNE